MALLLLIPAVVVLLAVTTTWLAVHVSPGVDRAFGRVARETVGRNVSDDAERARVLEAALVEETYEVYAAKTYLYVATGVVGGFGAGVLLVVAGLAVAEPLVRTLSGLPSTITVPLGFSPEFTLELATGTRRLIAVAGGLVAGVVSGIVAYVLRWSLPASDAAVRRRSIDAGLPRTTAFVYALTHGGMAVPDAIRIVGRNRAVFGETAREMRVASREMDTFGRDVITAVRRMGRRTPSERFKTFSENLASVLQSGSDRSAFFREQYERFQEEAEDRQTEVVELLATIAEGYVTTLVAGTLFFITILLVFGLTTTDTLWALQLVCYLIVPLANAGFVVYLASKLDTLGIARDSGGDVLDRLPTTTPIDPAPVDDGRRPDGGLGHSNRATGDAAESGRQLAVHDLLGRLTTLVRDPIRTVVRNPRTVLYVALPLAVVAFLLRFPAATQGTTVSVRVLDDLIVQSVLLVLVPYAVVREVYKRRVDRIEAATPEFLERLASLNEAGMTLREGISRVRGSDLGVLNPEVDRIGRDVRFGTTVEDAFVRFGRRVRTTSVTRVVTLVTYAYSASGDVAEVLRIAATQARADLRMRRQRRRQMFTYLVVIYVSFAVFLVIIFAVNEVLVPSLPQTVPTPSGGGNPLGSNVDQFARLGRVDKAAYALVFFHTALVQAACSGFIGGQLGEGTLKDGAKHAAIMLTIAYLVFVLLSSPVASIGTSTAVSTGSTMNVPSASASDGGFVVAYEDSVNGTKLGQSRYIPPGTHRDVTVSLDRPVETNRTVVLAVHQDTDGDERLSYESPYVPRRPQTDAPYPTIADRGTPGVEVEVSYVGA